MENNYTEENITGARQDPADPVQAARSMPPADRKSGKQRKFSTGLILGIFTGCVITLCGALIGRMIGGSSDIIDSETRQKMELISEIMEENFYPYEDQDPSVEDMRNGMYEGLVASYNDRYSEYFSEEEMREEMEDNTGIFYGIGAYISFDETQYYPVFTGTMRGTPAEAAGIHAGDLIVEVDGTSTYGLSSEDTAKIVRGAEGTVVHIRVVREGEDDYIDFDVTRAKIESVSVASEMLEGDVGYIAISSFELATVNQFTDQYQELRDQGAKGLILDLRSNTGGVTASAADIARQILPEGLIYYEEDANGNRQEYSCDGTHEIDIPLVVLINDHTASASEILTGAIRDYGIGTIMGTTSYGKGIVQKVIALSDGSAVKVTSRAYYSPKGINIQGKGIDPDIVVEFDGEAYYDKGIDNQLEAAQKEIMKQIGK